MSKPDHEEVMVFDTGPLRHFALEGWLGVLKFLAPQGKIYIPESVRTEVKNQSASQPVLNQILEAEWILTDTSIETDPRFQEYFAEFAEFLEGGSGYNLGECGVLAFAKLRKCTAIMDDKAPRKIAAKQKISYKGTLGLLCDAVNQQQLHLHLVEHLIDELVIGHYRFPFRRGEFVVWASKNGLLTPEILEP